jgi:hypothetical protein
VPLANAAAAGAFARLKRLSFVERIAFDEANETARWRGSARNPELKRARCGVWPRECSHYIKRVLTLQDGVSYRLIDRNVGLSRSTFMEIVRRDARV